MGISDAIPDSAAIVQHPYFPQSVILSGGTYLPNDWDVVTLIAVFGAGWAAIMFVTLLIVKQINPSLKKSDRALVLWFVLCKFDAAVRCELTWIYLTGSRRRHPSVL